MTDMRNRLKGLGISEARLAALGMGAPSTTAPAATGEPVSIFRAKYAEHRAPKPVTDAQRAANAAAVAALPAAEAEQRTQALQVFRAYAGADAITRSRIRGTYGSLIEQGRAVAAETEPTGPEAA